MSVFVNIQMQIIKRHKYPINNKLLKKINQRLYNSWKEISKNHFSKKLQAVFRLLNIDRHWDETCFYEVIIFNLRTAVRNNRLLINFFRLSRAYTILKIRLAISTGQKEVLQLEVPTVSTASFFVPEKAHFQPVNKHHTQILKFCTTDKVLNYLYFII